MRKSGLFLLQDNELTSTLPQIAVKTFLPSFSRIHDIVVRNSCTMTENRKEAMVEWGFDAVAEAGLGVKMSLGSEMALNNYRTRGGGGEGKTTFHRRICDDRNVGICKHIAQDRKNKTQPASSVPSPGDSNALWRQAILKRVFPF